MGKILNGFNSDQIINGFNVGKDYVIKVKRGGQIIDYKLELVNSPIPNVQSTLYEENGKKIGYIKLEIFSLDSYKKFKENLESLEYDSLIIDLRYNSGGEQRNLEQIASLFLGKDKVIAIDHYKDKDKIIKVKGEKTADYPIVILVNKGTASCSEILTLALKEECNATVIGTQTYGKGVGQTVKRTENYYYKITSMTWTSPSGMSINKVGITPDIEVKSIPGKDLQLEKAIEYLSK